MSTNHRPTFSHSEVIELLEIGPYQALLRGNIQSTGLIHYQYILEVQQDHEPILWVTSELSVEARVLGQDRPYFLCTFQEGTHTNYGLDQDWSDIDQFKAEAIKLARENLRLVERRRSEYPPPQDQGQRQ